MPSSHVSTQVDFMNVHVYTCNHHAVEDTVLAMRRYSRPVWVTEFACVLGSSTWLPTTADHLRKQLECVHVLTLRASPTAWRIVQHIRMNF